jgi:hypothetical protein
MKNNTNFTEAQQIRYTYRLLLKHEIDITEWWNLLQKHNSEIIANVCSSVSAAEIRLVNYLNSYQYKTKIRKYCNRKIGSDVKPYEVVRVISKRKVAIREMEATLINAPSSVVGGFLAHYENDEQKWEIKSKPDNKEEIITLVKAGWGYGQFRMSDKPSYFYDYNF